MKRKNKRRILKQISVLLCFTILLGMFSGEPQIVEASVWDNAYNYYQTYGNDVVFHPNSNNDGEIYYATKGGTSSARIKYLTIGWKVTITKKSGSKLQSIYFKLGGNYMYVKNTVTKSNYRYNLYVLSLGNLKRRMNNASLKAMKKGDIFITFDACVVVEKNGTPQGTMNDSGPVSGNVYTTYQGIAGAAPWSSTSMASFYNYFDKPVVNLYYKVQVRKEKGISKVSGGGEYCYGTSATLKAVVKQGYDFECWLGTGGKKGSAQVMICVNGNQVWTATAMPKELTIVFHRNHESTDTQTKYQKVYYRQKGIRFVDSRWNGDKKMLGWALSKNATSKDYPVNATIKGSWILKHSPKVDLYAVWETPSIPTTPDTPTPDTPTPDTPTPDTPTPDTPTPETPSIPDIPETPEPEPDKNIHCRFISQKYFEDEAGNLVPPEKGGLAVNSRWATDASLREILRLALWE